MSGHMDHDPYPECSHYWYGLGASTICEPPVYHAACPLCRTFRHVSDDSEIAVAYGTPPHGRRTWYTTVWGHGPFPEAEWGRITAAIREELTGKRDAAQVALASHVATVAACEAVLSRLPLRDCT